MKKIVIFLIAVMVGFTSLVLAYDPKDDDYYPKRQTLGYDWVGVGNKCFHLMQGAGKQYATAVDGFMQRCFVEKTYEDGQMLILNCNHIESAGLQIFFTTKALCQKYLKNPSAYGMEIVK